MKKILIIATFILILFNSCKQSEDEQAPSPGTPDALQEQSGSMEIGLTKSRYDETDLVEDLYSELLETNHDLNELEKSIKLLDDQKVDSLKIFKQFDSKNVSYYKSGQQHIDKITDSALRIKMKSLIDNSLGVYNKNIARHKALISIINTRDTSLENLHIILKLVRTLPMMEKYQKENTPSDKPIERVIRNFDKAILKTDSLTSK